VAYRLDIVAVGIAYERSVIVGVIFGPDARLVEYLGASGDCGVEKATYRGAVGGDLKTGDGAGMILQIPHKFFVRKCEELDITLPDKYGIDVLRQIKLQCPSLPVLILSMHPDEQYALRSIKAGASGYMNKQSAPSQLVTAIRQVAGGRKYISGELAEQLANDLTNEKPQDAPHKILSNREYQTLCLMASGKSLSEMADIMSLSAKTVSVYRSRMLEKMQLKNNAEAVRYAINNHLIE
jgi:two-component system invasion response regulator UvrY